MKEPIIVTTPEALRELIRDELAAALAKVRPEAPSEIMTTELVAELLHVHPDTVPRLVRTQGLPELRPIGTHRRFRRSDVIAWMANRKKSA